MAGLFSPKGGTVAPRRFNDISEVQGGVIDFRFSHHQQTKGRNMKKAGSMTRLAQRRVMDALPVRLSGTPPSPQITGVNIPH